MQKGDEGSAKDGDLVRFDLVRKGRFHVPQARVLESLGNPDDQRQISLIAVHAHGIPDDFPESVMTEAERLEPPTLSGRTDLRAIPLVTIDPPDARDHDDAVYAEPDADPANDGGFIVIVAIADVAHYVRSGTKLDREAQLRGNSVYFPDRVVPMLPERISNDLCSLREGEERACLAVRMIFDRHGAQAAPRFRARHDALGGEALLPGGAGGDRRQAVRQGRARCWSRCCGRCGPPTRRWRRRATSAQPLDLDLPERKIVLDAKGRVADVIVPERLAAHRLIEEFMIQANVAAAETLEAKRTPVVYRVHDQPSKEKLKNLREFLETLEHQARAAEHAEAGALQSHPRAGEDDARARPHQRGRAAQPERRPSTTSTTSVTSA